MSTTMERLLLVQDRDRKIAQLTRESEDIPARKKEIESRLNAQKESLHHAEEELKKQAQATKQIEGEVEARREKIAKYREQQFQIKSNVEYKALEHEIEGVEKEISGLEDKELTVMEEIDRLKGVIAEREKDLKQEENIVQQDVAALDKRAEMLAGEVKDLKADRAELAKDVDPDWLSRYERIMAHVGATALVKVDNGSCGGCHMNLPPHLVNDAKKDLSMTFCSFCGRILYWAP